MENFNLVLKILAVVAVVAGIIFVVVAYGDKIAEGVRSAVKFMKKKFSRRKETCFEDLAGMDAALGEGACHVMAIRPQGGVEAIAE